LFGETNNPHPQGFKLMAETIKKNDLLFHPVHGLCRVAAMTRSADSKELSYTLLPATDNKGKIRIVVPEKALENSGFSKLISSKEANTILDFFKTGKKADSQDSQAWKLAMLIGSESSSKESVKDSRKRQQVDRAVKGLAGELAFVLEKTSKEMAEIIQEHLGRNSDINPLVLTALSNIDKA